MVGIKTFLNLFRDQPWIIWWAIGLHLIWGTTLLVQPSVVKLSLLVGLNHLLELMPAMIAGVLLIFVALLALLSLVVPRETTFWRFKMTERMQLVLLMPQYFLLIAALLSDVEFLILARVPATGMHVERVIIVTILGPIMWAAVLHSIAIVERHIWRP